MPSRTPSRSRSSNPSLDFRTRSSSSFYTSSETSPSPTLRTTSSSSFSRFLCPPRSRRQNLLRLPSPSPLRDTLSFASQSLNSSSPRRVSLPSRYAASTVATSPRTPSLFPNPTSLPSRFVTPREFHNSPDLSRVVSERLKTPSPRRRWTCKKCSTLVNFARLSDRNRSPDFPPHRSLSSLSRTSSSPPRIDSPPRLNGASLTLSRTKTGRRVGTTSPLSSITRRILSLSTARRRRRRFGATFCLIYS